MCRPKTGENCLIVTAFTCPCCVLALWQLNENRTCGAPLTSDACTEAIMQSVSVICNCELFNVPAIMAEGMGLPDNAASLSFGKLESNFAANITFVGCVFALLSVSNANDSTSIQ